jgi:hypothetical protein
MLLDIVQDAEREIQLVYQVYTKYINQYSIPGDWSDPPGFYNELLAAVRSHELLTHEQQKFLNFLLNNRDLITNFRRGVGVLTMNIPDRPGVEIKLSRTLDNQPDEITTGIKMVNHAEPLVYSVEIIDGNLVNSPDFEAKIINVEKTPSSDFETKIVPINITKKRKIVHVTNYIPPDGIKSSSLKSRVKLAIKSIDQSHQPNVLRLGCCFESVKKRPAGWTINKLTRSARTSNLSNRHLAYLHDMLQSAADMCDEDDIILYSNMDCCVTPGIYHNILNCDQPVMLFHRRDVKASNNLYKIFTRSYNLKHTGIDAVAMTKSTYIQFYKHMLPDMLIGEPHWDTVLNNLTTQHQIPHTRNTTCLYHIEHDMTWHNINLSPAGKYNKQLMHNCVEYGMIKDEMIQLESEQLNVIIVLQHDKNPQVYDLCEKLRGQETFIVQPVPTSTTSCVYQDIMYVNKTLLTLSDKQLHLDQTNAIVNLITLTNQHHMCINYYIFKQHKKTLEPDHIVTYNNFEPLDIYENINNPLYVHLNDHGLLESC